MNIAITGSTGLVGSRICELLNHDFHFIPITHQSLDITDEKQVRERLSRENYDIFLHLAAYTNVDGAETERAQAHAINVTGTQNLFRATQEKNKKFIYFSTDFVFDGRNPPYTETSNPHPIGYYGQSKWEGEQVLNKEATIIRISYPYSPALRVKPDFVQRIKTLLEQGHELQMITDSSMTPTHIDDIAEALKHILPNPLPEIYHIVGTQTLSPFESGQMIAKHYGLSADLIKPTTYEEYMKNRAQRPRYSEITSINNTFHTMRGFVDGLKNIQ